MNRVIVLGGLGQFGRTAAEQLRRFGISTLIASRSAAADLQVNANEPASIRAAFGPGDIVLDAAGPFFDRSTALVEAAMEIGFDVIDINDDLRYAESIVALAPQIDRTRIRVLGSASSVSAVAAAVVRYSRISRPRSVAAFLAPASRRTANAGAAMSLLRCVGRRVRVFCDGRLEEFRGWSYPRRFRMPLPVGMVCGRLFESADAVHLPRIWTSLKDVSMYVDPNTPGANLFLQAAARSTLVRQVLQRQLRIGTWFARLFGSSAGGIGYEIEGAKGKVARYAIVSAKNSFITAVAPAVLAARAIAEDRFPHRGLVLPDRHVEPAELFAFLESLGVTIMDLG